jgi:hypothetical protein
MYNLHTWHFLHSDWEEREAVCDHSGIRQSPCDAGASDRREASLEQGTECRNVRFARHGMQGRKSTASEVRGTRGWQKNSEHVGLTARVEARSAALTTSGCSLFSLLHHREPCSTCLPRRETACWPLSGHSGPRTPIARQQHTDSRPPPSPRSPLLAMSPAAASRPRARSGRASRPTRS